MRHRIGFNRLDRRAGQRKAMLKNALTSLFIHERIKTTKAKALEIRRFSEKMITRAKIDSVHNRRIIAKVITKEDVLAKLFTEIAPRYRERAGGYTRILKIGQRQGDAADMVLLELVESGVIEEKKLQRRKRKEQKAEKAKAEEEKLLKEQEETAEAEGKAKKASKVKKIAKNDDEQVSAEDATDSGDKEDPVAEEE